MSSKTGGHNLARGGSGSVQQRRQKIVALQADADPGEKSIVFFFFSPFSLTQAGDAGE